MIFHFGFELPEPTVATLDSTSPDLTAEEIRILKRQIRQNTVLIDNHVSRIDLFVNKERYPKRAVFIEKLRRRLELLMEENDTFRKVLWKHYQTQDLLTERAPKKASTQDLH
jgi:hypothetical protein